MFDKWYDKLKGKHRTYEQMHGKRWHSQKLADCKIKRNSCYATYIIFCKEKLYLSFLIQI